MDSEGWSWRWEVSSNQNDPLAKAVLAFSFVLLAVAGLRYYARINGNRNKGQLPLPPGPRGLPLIGNLPFLERDLHCYFTKLSRTYGPIIKLQLGSKTCIVVSSPSTAKEILKDQDAIFANRDVPIAVSVITYGVKDMGFAPYGPTWRTLRKACVRDLMGKTSLDAHCELRRCQVRKTIGYMNSMAGTPINIGEQMFQIMLNLMINMLWGGTLKGEEWDDVGAEFRKAVSETVEIFSEPNISDFFPILAWFDLQGVERRAKRLSVLYDRIYDRIINQRLKMESAGTEEQGKNKEGNDFLQILLRLKEEDHGTPLTLDHIKAMLFDMVNGATDTTSTAIEWAMTEVMQHPKIMRNLQKELMEVVGQNNVVEESHLPKFYYLNAVLKEVFRLHPVAPLLLPRRPSDSCTVSGYTIPKDSQILVNTWAIHRDPTVWENPLKFQPERFLNVTSDKWDYNGNDYRYLPFGSGRRICVGIPMAERMLPYVMASLIHSFDWHLPEGEKLDFQEKFCLGLKKATPLIAIPFPRLSNQELYS